MAQYAEARHAEGGRTSECVLSRNASEYSDEHTERQAAHIASHYAVNRAVARVIAEHAFARRPQR